MAEPGAAAERMRRWRLVLGNAAAPDPQHGDGSRPGLGRQPTPSDAATPEAGPDESLSDRDAAVDQALAAVYDARPGAGRRVGGLAASAPAVHRWLGDIRTYFPAPVVQVLQQDAMDRLGLRQLLLEPEMLAAVQPDVHLVATLLSLRSALPEQTRQTARRVVRQVVDDIERRLEEQLHRAVLGALDRSARNRRPRLADVDWPATIRANLQNYQPELGTIIAERLTGYARRRRIAALQDVVLLVDQSGSMASSVVYAGVMAASLASLRAVRTSLVVFDTSVADLTDQLADPVEVLFTTQLGGGTDISNALAYAQSLVSRPAETVMVLVSDLFEGGDRPALVRRIAALVASGVRLVVLLALSDDGAPAYDHELAAQCAALGAPAFACTPDVFPQLLASVIRREDLAGFAARNGLVAAG
jgi:Mg-chelatase subunit ChlD